MGGSGAGKRLMGDVAHLMLPVRPQAVRQHQSVGQGGGREFRLCSDALESASYMKRLYLSVPM